MNQACGLCAPVVPLADPSAMSAHRAQFHPTSSAMVFFNGLVPHVPGVIAHNQQGQIPLPQGLNPAFTMGYVTGSQSAADPNELAGQGAMSIGIWNAFVAAFAGSQGWNFTPDSSVLLSCMLRFVLMHKGVNLRTGTDQLRFYNAAVGDSHLILSRDFFKAADDFWRERYNTGFSIQNWCLKFDSALECIWDDENNQIIRDVRTTKHGDQWATTNGKELSVGIPSWVPVGYLFPRKMDKFNLLVARSPIPNSMPGVEEAQVGRLINVNASKQATLNKTKRTKRAP